MGSIWAAPTPSSEVGECVGLQKTLSAPKASKKGYAEIDIRRFVQPTGSRPSARESRASRAWNTRVKELGPYRLNTKVRR